jgi:hypothetical protein
MRFVAFRRKRVYEGRELEQLPQNAVESLSRLSGVPHEAHTYTELREQIHNDLRIQHPEWIKPNGECPMCDAYEARLTELFDHLGPNADNESVAAHDSNFEHGLN